MPCYAVSVAVRLTGSAESLAAVAERFKASVGCAHYSAIEPGSADITASFRLAARTRADVEQKAHAICIRALGREAGAPAEHVAWAFSIDAVPIASLQLQSRVR